MDGATEVVQDAMYKMGSDFKWEQIFAPISIRESHCMVQISDCEIALIGGTDDGSNPMDTIEIYNYMTNTVRNGPT